MTYPNEDVKDLRTLARIKLGHGWQKRYGKELGISQASVSRTVRGNRPDRRLARRIARGLRIPLASLPAELWGEKATLNGTTSNA